MIRARLAVTAIAIAATALAGPQSALAATPTTSTQTDDQTYVLTRVVSSAGPTLAVAPAAMKAKALSRGATLSQAALIASANGCWSGSYWVQGYNFMGWVLFRYNESHDWCGSNGYITYTSVYTWPSNLFAGVSYAGDSKNSVYGVGWNVWKEHLSGHFTAIATPWITVYNYYPWMEFYVGGGGQTYYEHWGA